LKPTVEKSANCISTAHPFNRRAYGRADNGILADGSVNDPSGKFPGQVFGGLEGAAKSADILPVNENARVFRQRPCLRFANRFEIGDAHFNLAA
jgi:hypothetical protein